MKLLKLSLKAEYGSLKNDFELNFRESYDPEITAEIDWNQFHPFCFAGLNGSGKSNVLEALANIFYHLESCVNINQPEIFKTQFSANSCKPDAFELEYYINPEKDKKSSIQNMVLVSISKKPEMAPEMCYSIFPFNENQIPVTVVADKKSKIPAPAKIYLPDLVIGYSSGENEILSIPFLKTRLLHYDEYREVLKKKEKYKAPESNLLYIDYEMSQAVLLSNFIFQERAVLEPLETELGITDIKRFRMNLNNHTEEHFNIFENYDSVIKAFKNCATTYFEDEEGLTLDFWINKATKESFKKNFPDGIFQLFQAFQVLYTLNYRTVTEEIKSDVYQSKGFYTDGKVPNPAPEDKVFYFLDYYISKNVTALDGTEESIQLLMKNLSDGEQQFLHTLGICLMLKDKTALLLLDEPETHFNPGWRSKFMRTLQKSLEASQSDNLMREIVITSHSPFIISDCFPDKVIIFEKGKQPKNARDTNLRTYGTSIDIIMESIFKKNNTIGDLSRNEIEEIQEKIKNKKSLSGNEVIKLKKSTAHLGDSMEKILLFAQLNELNKDNA